MKPQAERTKTADLKKGNDYYNRERKNQRTKLPKNTPASHDQSLRHRRSIKEKCKVHNKGQGRKYDLNETFQNPYKIF